MEDDGCLNSINSVKELLLAVCVEQYNGWLVMPKLFGLSSYSGMRIMMNIYFLHDKRPLIGVHVEMDYELDLVSYLPYNFMIYF